ERRVRSAHREKFTPLRVLRLPLVKDVRQKLRLPLFAQVVQIYRVEDQLRLGRKLADRAQEPGENATAVHDDDVELAPVLSEIAPEAQVPRRMQTFDPLALEVLGVK